MRLLSAASFLLLTVSVCGQENRLLLQKPTVSKGQIVFTHAGDLWSVPRVGGDATRLTSGTGLESDAAFSPDGQQIAFTGEYDGNVDVFVVPSTGGVPKRLTWHPQADRVMGWTPDGKRILFTSPRTAYSRFAEMFSVPADGGIEERLPFPSGYAASVSGDGQQIAYEPVLRAFNTWKQYRGGRTSRIWLAKMSDSSITPVPRTNSNDFNPMWAGDRVYFLSDRNGPVTLFSYDLRNKGIKELVSNKGLDLKSAALGPDAIVYEQFGGIWLYDLKAGTSKQVPIRVQGDFPELRARFVNVGKRLESPGISPGGARAVFATRGEVVTVPAENGDARNITNTPGAADREPVWSPDGKSIAYLSDESGEYALHIAPQSGAGPVKRIELKPGFYSSPRYSPDCRSIALYDTFGKLWYVDLETKKQVEVDGDTYQMRRGNISGSWSPDGKWLAYSKSLPSSMSAIYLYSLADGKRIPLTDGMSDALYPVFDRDGKYLYFVASTNSGESLAMDIRATGRSSTSSVYLTVLRKDEPSPFAPRSDEEKSEEPAVRATGAPAPDKTPAAEAAKPKPGPTPTQIDAENLDQRILAVPMPARNYTGLQLGKAGVLLALEAQQGTPGNQGPGGSMLTVHRYDVKAQKSDAPLAGVSSFVMSHGGEKALYRQGENWVIAALRPMPTGGAATGPAAVPGGAGGGPGQGTLKVDALEVRVDPTQAWQQMYREIFRLERDWFYDRNAHGFDLKAAEKNYEPYLKNVASRSDLTYLFEEILGNLVVSHMGVGGGDVPEVKRVQTGLLGADYDVSGGRYRFARVYRGENWNPQLRAPLTQPGVNIRDGEFLIAVNGREALAKDNVHSFFEGLANKSVMLKVAADANGTNAREVSVVPVADETMLRNRAWIEDNRRKVTQLTGGKVAYIYMPDTATGGLAAFQREFYAQVGKQAAIIDERFNAGGLLATDVAEIMNRKVLSAAANRAGDADLIQPQGIFGPKVMLINESAGSGGDAMPWYFRRSGAGKLVGTRTWGGLVGMAGTTALIDGGRVGAPSSGIYNPISGEWEVENVGIAPDVEVIQDPALVRKGRDPQLEKAVEEVMEELRKNPPPTLRRPAFPNYYRSRPQPAALRPAL